MNHVVDRCDVDTIAILDSARDNAQLLGHNYIGTEHVLLAFTIHRDHLPDRVAGLLPTEDQVREALAAMIDRGPTLPKAELLETLGINLDEVRAAVRQTFGADAIQRLGERRVHQPWQPWRHPTRACISLLAGGLGVAPRLKQALAIAADRVTEQHPHITPALLLLGMIDVEDAFSNRLLRDLGVPPDHIRSALQTAS